jgi:hypothetical protein
MMCKGESMSSYDTQQVVASLRRMAGSILTLPDEDWLAITESSLRLGAVTHWPTLGPRAAAIARQSVAQLTDAARVEHLRVIGQVARAAQIIELIHHHVQDDGRAADTAERSAVTAFRWLERASGGGNRKFAVADNVALWVLASAALIHEDIGTLLKQGITRKYQSDLGTAHRWPEYFLEDRRSDLEALTADDPDMRALIKDLSSLLAVPPEDGDSLEALASLGAADACWCSRSDSLAEKLWSEPSFARWKPLIRSEDDRKLMADFSAIGGSRADFLVLGDDAVGLGIPGTFDSLLVLALSRTTTEAAVAWHEACVAKEVRASWSIAGDVAENVAWVEDANVGRTSPRGRPHHDGEIDVLVQIEGAIVDVQAKAARSDNPDHREKLPVVQALKQHSSLRQAGTMGVTTVPDSASPAAAAPLRIGPGGLAHIPVTVGTETVHGWAVGRIESADRDDLPRVLTTVDHMRVVNTFVPENYRPAYWIDRYAQQYEGLFFVSELDFLNNWISMLWGEDGAIRVVSQRGLVLASESFLERYIAVANIYADAKSLPEVAEWMNSYRRELESHQPNESAPRFETILRELLVSRTPGALALSRFAMNAPRPALDQAFDTSDPKVVPSRLGVWTVSFEPVARARLDQERIQLALFRTSDGTWRVWERNPWAPGLANGQPPIPRYSAPEQKPRA